MVAKRDNFAFLQENWPPLPPMEEMDEETQTVQQEKHEPIMHQEPHMHHVQLNGQGVAYVRWGKTTCPMGPSWSMLGGLPGVSITREAEQTTSVS